jgi:hypothetical protein
VVYQQTVDRRAYFPLLGEEVSKKFYFHSPSKAEQMHVYHISDVHKRFALAKQCAGYFGKEVDLFIVNGDIGEVECEQDYLDVAEFTGYISRGEVPVLFTRGNHDVRGRFAEHFCDYFPARGKALYFTFEVGCLAGVVFDCGEDKRDFHEEYGGKTDADGTTHRGVNLFEAYRRQETEYLKTVKLPQDKIKLAVGHIVPVKTTYNKGDCFDIEREVYSEWNSAFECMNIEFMLCGHMHHAHIINQYDESSTISHNYPVVVGAECRFGDDPEKESLWGAALIFDNDSVKVLFTDEKGQVHGEYTQVFYPMQKMCNECGKNDFRVIYKET